LPGGLRPTRRSAAEKRLTPPVATPNYDHAHPKFCFEHIQPDFDVKSLSPDQQAALACALQEHATLTWQQIKLAQRHGLGCEKIPAAQIKPSIPLRFSDADHFLAMRYSGRPPMVGSRVNDVFHIIWIESSFGDLYDHGS